ncbi:Sapep family Mn(2+)-dependent dipeptidase [Mesoplasma lactucae]|uniref:Peptidase M20 n=1 Tax=Mesoplasma lactucae ATCC 49193 TaxID=81460 RepID=A0A291IQX4_9MOLU|nr:Sapep family Mn(2+)-dependent dipeptidase [Mesoplasma lactucae]ATG97262.1 peptidase M20 [Mesoplasma lactucae ATCC 49193]ATZ20289.1 dipeptidase PepV [Mesoplasma lactucae ATCC 49193]MCL8216460.1 putative dipeptidase [Mesoplasma lactucae ATCC 49193]
MKIDEKVLIDKYFKEAYEQTKKILSIPSYAQPKEANKPFGPGVYDVLNYVMDLAKSLGFETHKDEQNRYGFLDFGKGDEIFVILGHLDVVPPGNIKEWVTPPFTPIEQDGKLIGRGAFDDKGPTMMNLYALKYLLDNGFEPDYKIRMIFGLTEETTWESIHAYIDDYGYGNVAMGYTPDAEFPVVYAEKWVVDLDVVGNLETDFSIKGGEAYNVVDDLVTYKGPKTDDIATYLKENNIPTSFNDKNELVVQGKAGHGSLPWLGINAATWLGRAMKNVGIKNEVVDSLNNMHEDYYAKNFVKPIDDETGPLTQNLGIINVENGKQKFSLNFRVPALANPQTDFIKPYTDKMKEYGFDVENISIEDHVYVDKNSELIKKIMKAYQEVTGDYKSEPLAIGGGTYAKAMPNVVAFGAEFDMDHSTMHAYNEFVYVDDLKKMLEIYTKALVLLTKKDK